jgi:hypothetical protein
MKMNIDYDAIHRAARRERTIAINQFLFAPIVALVRRLTRPEPRKPAAAFPVARSC